MSSCISWWPLEIELQKKTRQYWNWLRKQIVEERSSFNRMQQRCLQFRSSNSQDLISISSLPTVPGCRWNRLPLAIHFGSLAIGWIACGRCALGPGLWWVWQRAITDRCRCAGGPGTTRAARLHRRCLRVCALPTFEVREGHCKFSWIMVLSAITGIIAYKIWHVFARCIIEIDRN